MSGTGTILKQTTSHALNASPMSRQRRLCRHFENVSDAVPRFRRTLQIRMRTDPLRNEQRIFRCDWLQLPFGEFFMDSWVVAQIFLIAN